MSAGLTAAIPLKKTNRYLEVTFSYQKDPPRLCSACPRYAVYPYLTGNMPLN